MGCSLPVYLREATAREVGRVPAKKNYAYQLTDLADLTLIFSETQIPGFERAVQ